MWTLLFACQEPFLVDRHDLVGFRIAAVSAPPVMPGDLVRPSVALIVEGRPWSASLPDLAWYWVDSPEQLADLDPLSEAAAAGPLPELVVPEEQRMLGVIAKVGDAEARAFLTIAEGEPSFSGPDGVSLAGLPLSLGEVEGGELLLEARRGLDASDYAAVSPGDFLRLTATVEGDPLVRWMATKGTFFELDRRTTDWAAADLLLDEDEIEEGATPIEPGWVTFLALALGAPGETRFRAVDVPVGLDTPGLWTGGRFVPTDVPVAFAPGDAVRGTLQADDASPFGLRLTSPVVSPASEIVDYGTSALPCLVTRDGPLDPGWWLTAVCGRDGAIGAEVVVLPEQAP